jgi:hypothetical protein
MITRFLYSTAFFILLSAFSLTNAQNSKKVKSLPPGYPDRSASLDVLPGFKNPPPGYGEVSFYWWLGDTLTKERITWQLDQLAHRSITGLQVNYAHSDEGGNIWGLTYPGQPRLFSKEWWDLFSWFLQEAKARNMSVSLSDYTLGIAGQGWFVDEMLIENPELHGSRLLSKEIIINANLDTLIKVPDNIVSAIICRLEGGRVVYGSSQKMTIVNEGKFHVIAADHVRTIVMVYPETVLTSFDPMNPLSGKKVIEKFFQPFEDHCPGESGKGLNFFFSDELNFGISGFLWNKRFAAEFKERKGYDIVPELPALFIELDNTTPKIRMDYNDVLVALSEESFFIPVFKWHTERGMLFGCDHGGRGLDVTEFGDYFRSQRWMSGPGCDQPVLSQHINKNKVASSIAHLYERPRTWLEGFHSSGWGTSSASLAEATFTNFAMGQNLLSLHGLYYSTHGGWWEWAPPDNHFRQPYWANMDHFLKCTERLSYILSQGYHRCDVAILYPVTPMVAGINGDKAVSIAFEAGEELYKAGIDYDFIDFESLNRCKVKDGELKVSGESYKVLILPAMSATRHSTMVKAQEFFQSGGIVIAIGAVPVATERIGRGDPELQAMNNSIFGNTEGGYAINVKKQINRSKSKKGYGIYLDKPYGISQEVSGLITPDFSVLAAKSNPYIHHRKVGNRDIYYVYGVPKDTVCFFRCTGKAELWNPWTGELEPLPVLSSGEFGTELKMPLTETEPQLIVFSPGDPIFDSDEDIIRTPEEILLVGDWGFEIKPTLDNRWGDYRQPAYEGYVATDANLIRYKKEESIGARWQSADFNDISWDTVKVSYGPQFWRLGPLPDGLDSQVLEQKLSAFTMIDPSVPVTINGTPHYWEKYEFSWRWGLKGNPGRQGYHGLKEWIHDDVFQFGEAVRDWPGVPSPRIVSEKGGPTYFLWSTVLSDRDQDTRVLRGGINPSAAWLNGSPIPSDIDLISMKKGANPILLKYTGPGIGYLVFENLISNSTKGQSIPLSSRWFANQSVLPFDLTPDKENQVGWYRFKAPPGLKSIELALKNKPQIWVNGKEIPVKKNFPLKGLYADTLQISWKSELADNVSGISAVAIRVQEEAGFYGGAAFPEPIRLNCTKGLIRLGDLKDNESLMTYSGGMWYRKSIALSAEQVSSPEIILDLGELVSTAEVFVNGKSVGKRLTAPWHFNVSGKLNSGINQIDVLIYNTLGNYYLTTPSSYVGETKSGLMGPVRLLLH